MSARPISTSGAGAYGVIAQSVSGGGGLVMNGTTMELVNGANVLVNGSALISGKAAVYVQAGGSVTASGLGGTGISAQGNGDPIITLAAGTRVTGGPSGTAIVSDGTETYITSYGTISTLDGADGRAIRTSTGFAQIVNGGSLTGNLALTPGAANSVTNLPSGTLWAGSSLDLGGAGNVLTNAGTLRSAFSSLGTTTLNGSLVQTSSGVLAIRADQLSGQSDRFLVAGDARLSGGVVGTISNPGRAMPGHFDTPFLSVARTLSTDNLVALGDTAILDFSLANIAGGLSLGTTIDFTPFGLSKRGLAVGTLIGEIQTRGSSALFETIVPALLQVTTVAGLEQSYETVGGGAVSMVPTTMINAASATLMGITTQMDLWRSGLRPASTALGYAAPANGGTSGSSSGSGESAAGGGRFFWGAPMASLTTGGGLSGSSIGGMAGLDGVVDGLPLLAGAALSFSTSGLAANAYGADVSTSYGSLSLYGLYEAGPAYVSAIATVGYGSANFSRNLYNLGLNLATDSGLDGWILGGRIEAGYSFALGNTGANLTPFVAFQPIQLWLGSGSEEFNLGPGIQYEATSITALPLYLGVQIDGIWMASNGQRVAPYLRAAWMHDFSPDRDIPRSFAELPNLTFSGTPIPTISNALDLHAGLQFLAGPNTALSASLDAQVSESYSTLGASASFRVRW